MLPKIRKQSGLDLTLSGTLGKFRIGGSGGDHSAEVVYLQTQVGFDHSVPSNEKLLRHLEPVREIFDYQTLDFDEIMQRDIDDTRVSKDMIPYLLDPDARGSIKFFPPIVVVVLPVADMLSKPSRYYPKVDTFPVPKHPEFDTEYEFIRSGEVGAEAFQFEYPLVDKRPHNYDYVRLRLNSNRVRLVIIDGQHRAMALLALYRNLKDDWNDKRRMPFQNYYQEWTKAKIAGFDLAGIQLPMIICTFPELDTEHKGDLDIVKAARRMFLTLNKEARKVSNTRNILLNDRDLISHFLRETLGEIKRRDVNAESPFRIWNVELDQYKDRSVISSTSATTGVSHVHFAIEHMLLDANDVKGIRARSGVFQKRKSVETTEPLNARLDGANVLGAEASDNLRRDDYTRTTAEKLSVPFRERYGQFITAMFDKFKPFEIHSRACLQVENGLQGNANPQVHAILFEGQNIGRTFEEYRTYMKDKEKGAKQTKKQLPAEIQSIISTLDGTHESVQQQRRNLLRLRTEFYLDGISDKAKLRDTDPKAEGKYSVNIHNPVCELYDTVFTTVAFQAAILCGYFLVIEKAERCVPPPTQPRTVSFAEYIGQLNDYFVPGTVNRLKNVIRAFFYDPEGEKAETWKEVATHETFNDVVFRGEMKPEEWPKYRLPLLELWQPTDPAIQGVRNTELAECRRQALKSLHAKVTKEVCVGLRKSEPDLTADEWTTVFEQTFERFDHFLENLGLTKAERLKKEDARKIVDEVEEPETADDEDGEAIVPPPVPPGPEAT